VGAGSGIYPIRYPRPISYFSILSALAGRLRRVVGPTLGLAWKNENSAPITPIQPLPSDTAHLTVCNPAAKKGGDEVDVLSLSAARHIY